VGLAIESATAREDIMVVYALAYDDRAGRRRMWAATARD
jgi:hypothetical protein